MRGLQLFSPREHETRKQSNTTGYFYAFNPLDLQACNWSNESGSKRCVKFRIRYLNTASATLKMLAQNSYVSSVLRVFAQFVHDQPSRDVQTIESARLLLIDVCNRASQSFAWSTAATKELIAKHSLAATYDDQTIDVVLQFVHSYPPHQTNVAVFDFLLALEQDGCSPSTIKNYRSDINQFVIFAQQRQLADLLTKPKVIDFLKCERQRGLKTASILRKLVSITQLCLWAEQQGVITPTARQLEQLKKLLVSDSHLDAAEETPKISPSRAPSPNEHLTKSRENKVKTWSLPTDQLVQPDYFVAAGQQRARARQEYRAQLKSKLAAFSGRIGDKLHVGPNALLPFINVAMMVVFFLGLGVFGYQQFVRDSNPTLAYPTTPTRPNRYLSYQGRLTDLAENPITTATDMRFFLYDSGPSTSGGAQLWDSTTCTVTPDQDGIFSVSLGDDCGSEIDANIFSESATIWLQVQIEAETLSPRQSIKSVAYALNSETLQGYPISATGAATVNTVVTMNSGGEIVLAENSPTIRSVMGTFSLEAQSLLLQTSSGSNGNITIDPDGTGNVSILSNLLALQGYLAAPGATLSATYAGGVPLTVKGGPSGTANLSEWQNSAGTPLTTLSSGGNLAIEGTISDLSDGTLQVNDDIQITGNDILSSTGATVLTLNTNDATFADALTVTGDLTLSGGDITGANSAAIDIGEATSGDIEITGDLLPAADATYDVGSTAKSWRNVYVTGNICFDDSDCASTWAGLSGADYWRLASGAFSPVNDTADLLIGSNATSSAKFAFLNVNTGTPTASISANSGNITTYVTGDGTLGTTNRQTLTIGNSSTYNTTGNVLLNPNGTGYVGIGTTNPAALLDVKYANNELKFGGNSLEVSTDNSSSPAFKVTGTGTADLVNIIDGTTEIFTILDGGNIGIGSTAPNGLLQISGAATGKALTILNQTGDQAILTASASGATKFIIANDGNVGIGTTAPSGHLHVKGNDSNQLIVDNGDASWSTAIAQFKSNTVGRGSNGAMLEIQGFYAGRPRIVPKYADGSTGTRLVFLDTSSQTIDIIDSNRSLAATTTGASGTSSYLKLTATGGVQLSGISDVATTTLDIQGISGQTGDLLNISSFGGSSGDLLTILANGNVGIGTTAPLAKLSINNDFFAQAATISATYNSGIPLTLKGGPIGTGDIQQWQDSAGNVLARIESTGRSTLANNTSYAMYNAAGSTVVPLIRLDSSDNLNIGSAATVADTFVSGSSSVRVSIGGNEQLRVAGTAVSVNESGLSTVDFRVETDTDANALFTQASTNNVGIGTNNPNSFKLQVAGSIGPNTDSTYNLGSLALAWANIYGDAIYQNGNLVCDSSGANCPAGGANYWRLTSGAFSPVNDTTDLLLGSSASSSAKFAFLNVNTGTPTASISANSGNIAASLTGTGVLGTTNRQTLTIGGSDTGNLSFASGGSTAMTILANGNVGIGTTTVGAKLVAQASGSENIFLAKDSGGTTRTTITNDGYIDLSNTDDPDVFNTVFKINSATVGGSEISGGFGNGFIKQQTTGRSLLNLISNSTSNSLLSGGVESDTYRSFSMLGNGTWNVGSGTADPDTSLSRLSTGGWQLQTTAASAVTAAIAQNSGQSGNLLQVRSSGSSNGDFLTMDASGNLGIGSTAPLGKVQVSGQAKGKALVILNETGDQRIFSASAAGTTVLNLENTGDLAIEGDLMDLSGTTLAINDDLQVRGNDILSSTGATVLTLNTNDATFADALTITGDLTLSGGDITGANSAAIDIGEATSGDIEITGDLLPSADATYDVGSTTKSWRNVYVTGEICFDDSDCASSWTGLGGGTNYWRLASGAFSPVNDTADLLLGSDASASAKFAFLNVNTGTPTASISANSGNIAASLTGTGVLGTTNRQTLTIGGSDTGNLSFASGGSTAMTILANGNVGIGTTAPSALLDIQGGNVRIGARADSSQATQTSWSRISQSSAGTIASGGTASIASASASVVWNGSLYVGTSKSNAAEVYRYDGGTTWTKITQSTAGTIASSGTANIDMVASMMVYGGQLYIGTRETDAAEVYRYDGGTTWTKVSQSTAGTIRSGGTASIDGVTAMGVYQGRLYAGTQEGTKAELYRYDGGTTWTVINTTAGQFVTTNSVSVDRVSSMAVFNGTLFIGTAKAAAAADLLRYNGNAGASVFTKMNSNTSGTFAVNGSQVASYEDVATLSVYNGSLIVGLQKANAADVVMYDGNSMLTTLAANFQRLNSSTGTILTGGTSSINTIRSAVSYKGHLYISTTEGNSAQVYRYEGNMGAVTVWSQVGAAAGSFGATTSIDGAMLQVYNDSLIALTEEASSAEVYQYTTSISESNQLIFNAEANTANGEQNGLTNDGRIFFSASPSANVNTGTANTGAFIFSHAIKTDFGAYDLAEDYATRDDQAKPGDVISLDSFERGMVTRSSSAYDKLLIGVYSTKPALRLSQRDATINGGTAIPVALAGRVPVNVSTESGAIKPGDMLTSSSQPGVAMKAVEPGPILGKALEAYEGDGVGQIEVFMSIGMGTGEAVEPEQTLLDSSEIDQLDAQLDIDLPLLATQSGSMNASGAAALSSLTIPIGKQGLVVLAQTETGTYTVTPVGKKPLETIAALSQAVIGQITAGITKTQELVVEKTAQISSLTVGSLNIGAESLESYITRVVASIDAQREARAKLAQLPPELLSPVVESSDSAAIALTLSPSPTPELAITSHTTLLTEQLTTTTATITGSLAAGELNAQSARIQQLETKIAQFEAIKTQTAEIVDATISGTLYAAHINDIEQQIASALQKPSLLATIMGSTQDSGKTLVSASLAQLHQIATSSASLDVTLAELPISPDDVVLNASATFIDQYLKVNGTAYVAESMGVGADLLVGHSVKIGSGMHIADGSIEYTSSQYLAGQPTSQVLAIQPSGHGQLSLMAGLLTLSETGDVHITGNLHVAGNLEVTDTLLTNLLQPADFGSPFQVQVAGVSTQSGQRKESRFEIVNELGTPVATISAQGKAVFAGGVGVATTDLRSDSPDQNQVEATQTSGKATVVAGQQEITINTKLLGPNSLVYITPISSTGNQVLYVKSQREAKYTGAEPATDEQSRLSQTTAGSFVVGFDQPTQQPVSFNWWIVN